MFAVSSGLCLYIFSVFERGKKISYELLPVTVVLMAVTVTGWGTLVHQMAGVLSSSAPFTGETAVRVIEINPLSGVFIMLCLGFGWMPLFGFMMGRFFSDKKYALWHILLAIAVFFAVQYLCKATVSHIVLRLINPEAVGLFKDGLLDKGISDSPYFAYMNHFDSDSWAKTVPGGRNYCTSTEVISSVFGALGVFVYQRFFLRDKTGGRTSLAVMSISSLGITLAGVCNLYQAPGKIYGDGEAPELLRLYGWSFWEYFTGFFIGLGLMILFVCLSSKKREDSGGAEDRVPKLAGIGGFFYHGLFTLFGICLTIIRPAAINFANQEYTPLGARIYSDINEYNAAAAAGADPATIVCIQGGLVNETTAQIALLTVILVVCLAVVYKNLIKKKLGTPINMDVRQFCEKAFFFYFTACAVVYFFLGGAYLLHPGLSPVTWLMVFSAAAVFTGYFIIRRIRAKASYI